MAMPNSYGHSNLSGAASAFLFVRLVWGLLFRRCLLASCVVAAAPTCSGAAAGAITALGRYRTGIATRTLLRHLNLLRMSDEPVAASPVPRISKLN
jgi:hypothetical protein